MSGLQLYAFVILPLLLAAVGFGPAWLFVWSDKRRNRLHPGE